MSFENPTTLADWQTLADSVIPGLASRAFIDDTFVAAESGDTFESRNPATGELLAQVASCDEPDATRAAAVARRAFADGAWSRLAPGKRKKTLLRLADLMEANKHELALIDT
ncbi:MAG: aldehyde dehydrogenase family protein, partial [Halomonadaceae bacterium]